MDPAGGSTAKTAATASAVPTSQRTGRRAPRATATSPAPMPAVPVMTATHSATVTSPTAGCSGIHHGGPAAGAGNPTTALLGPATETAIMISRAAPMPVSASRPRSRLPLLAGRHPGGWPGTGGAGRVTRAGLAGCPTPGTAVMGAALYPAPRLAAASLIAHAPPESLVRWTYHPVALSRRAMSTPRHAMSTRWHTRGISGHEQKQRKSAAWTGHGSVMSDTSPVR